MLTLGPAASNPLKLTYLTKPSGLHILLGLVAASINKLYKELIAESTKQNTKIRISCTKSEIQKKCGYHTLLGSVVLAGDGELHHLLIPFYSLLNYLITHLTPAAPPEHTRLNHYSSTCIPCLRSVTKGFNKGVSFIGYKTVGPRAGTKEQEYNRPFPRGGIDVFCFFLVRKPSHS